MLSSHRDAKNCMNLRTECLKLSKLLDSVNQIKVLAISDDFTTDPERITKESTQNFILKIEEIIKMSLILNLSCSFIYLFPYTLCLSSVQDFICRGKSYVTVNDHKHVFQVHGTILKRAPGLLKIDF